MRVKIFVLLCSCLILQGCTDATPEITSLSDSVPPSVGRGDISSDSSSDKNSSIEDGAWRIHVPAVARNFTIKGS